MKRKLRESLNRKPSEKKDDSIACKSSPVQEDSTRKRHCALDDLEALPSNACTTPKHQRTYGRRINPVSIQLSEQFADPKVVSHKGLSEEFHPYLSHQKQLVLAALCRTPSFQKSEMGPQDGGEELPANSVALHELSDLLEGSIERNEGNSCVLFGPPGSGKTTIFESALQAKIANRTPIVIRLNGLVHRTDRLAMKEIARQVVQQSGIKKFGHINTEDEDNPLVENEKVAIEAPPPPSHLPSLIGALPNLQRPVIVLLDAFEQFTLQPRQALLYCLLDTVQSCRAGSTSQRGMAVIGLTTRLDVVSLLEKRVKSRFSHRLIRTASLRKVDGWILLLRSCLVINATYHGKSHSTMEQWQKMWTLSVQNLIEDRSFKDFLNEVFCVTRDVRVLLHATRKSIVQLSPAAAFLTTEQLRSAFNAQRSPPISMALKALRYPAMVLLVAAQNALASGFDAFTFEHLHYLFTTEVRASSAAPVMFGGSGINMVSVSRACMWEAFQDLVRARILVQGAAGPANLPREFVMYRCAVQREDVKAAVDSVGQTSVKKWFNKARV